MANRPFLTVESGKPIKFETLPHLIALALHPEGEMAYAAARINLESELPQLVVNGKLIVRNASGLGRHTMPVGPALQQSVVLPEDLRPVLSERSIDMREIEQGSGPQFWTLDNAAMDIAEQENWHSGARAALLDQMSEAAASGALRVRDPLTDLPYRPRVIRTFHELVSPADVNGWLESCGAPYRWKRATDEDDEIDAGAWADATLQADFWFARRQVTPEEAARLLMEMDPHTTTVEQAMEYGSSETTSEDFKRLLRAFWEVKERHDLKGWIRVAEEQRLKIHPWVTQYAAAFDAGGAAGDSHDGDGRTADRGDAPAGQEETPWGRPRLFVTRSALGKV